MTDSFVHRQQCEEAEQLRIEQAADIKAVEELAEKNRQAFRFVDCTPHEFYMMHLKLDIETEEKKQRVVCVIEAARSMIASGDVAGADKLLEEYLRK